MTVVLLISQRILRSTSMPIFYLFVAGRAGTIHLRSNNIFLLSQRAPTVVLLDVSIRGKFRRALPADVAAAHAATVPSAVPTLR